MPAEASQLIENLQNQISKLDTIKADNPRIEKINCFIDLLTNGNLDFDETMNIINELCAISAGIPTTTQIFDNIEQEVIYEEVIYEEQDVEQ